MEPKGFANRERKPRWGLISAVVLVHVLGVFGLASIFAPGVTESVQRTVVSAFTVTITAPEEEEAKKPEPDEGAAGNPGERATPKPVTAPTPKIPVKQDEPMPRASSTGTANASGARESGDGTGAAGDGLGTGSGNRGGGTGGGIASKPSVRSGGVDPRDFPRPEGGRQERFGKSVIVVFTVTTDGRARNCSVSRTSVDAQTTARVCPLVIDKVRFNPARNAAGQPVEARYGYRVDFKPR